MNDDAIITQKLANDLDQHASNLANDNDVEAAWFLRGVAAALAAEPFTREGGEYAKEYRIGYMSIADARGKLEI